MTAAEMTRLSNVSATTILAWAGAVLSIAGLSITAWRWHRHRRGIASWTGCEPSTPTGAWLDPRTGSVEPEVEIVVRARMNRLFDEGHDEPNELVQQTTWELARCDETALSPAARGHLLQIAEDLIEQRRGEAYT